MESLSTLATLSIASGVLSLLCLVALHVVSPEYSPAWRMVSEYALGKHKWLLTLFFTFWGVSTLLTAVLLWPIVTTPWAIVGMILVFISGVGAVMGGLFDVKKKLHGLSFMLGVPTLPIGALLMSYHLIKNESWDEHQSIILLSAHAIWISTVLMAISMMLIFSGFKKAGMPVGPNAQPPEVLPNGVIGINGYANRLLIVCYIAWPLLIASLFHLSTAN
jgi:hypothetical membrane protein